MWLLFHRSKKTRVVPDGEQFVETCPTCKVRGTFLEVQMEENVGLFFVDMFGDKQRAFRCSSCLETFEWKDQLPEGEGEIDNDDTHAIEAPKTPKTWEELDRERRQERLRALTAEKLAQKRATPTDRRQQAAREIASEIADELAAIKARLGR